MKRYVLSLIAAASILAASVRAAAPPDVVTHDATEKKTSVTLRVTGTLKIVLPGKDDPGHQWQIVSNDPRILKSQGDVKPVGGAKAPDKAAPWEVTFVGQRPGRSIVRFVWTKGGAGEVASPDEVREVSVRVQ